MTEPTTGAFYYAGLFLVAAPLALLVLYLAIRLGSAAYYRSKSQFFKHGKEH